MAITDTRVAPHSVEAEEAVLGSVLINPNAFTLAADLLKTGDFFIIRHGWIWDAMLRLHNRQEDIDYLTVTKELEAHDHLEEIGGRAYLMYLINNTPTSIHAETYARQMRRYAKRRELLEAAGRIAELAYEEQLEDQEVFDGAESALLCVTNDAVLHAPEPVDGVWSDFYAAFTQAEDKSNIVSLGLIDLDDILGGGLERGELGLVAGRPGMGKSGFLLTVALNCARRGLKTLVLSMEMTKNQMMRRLIAMDGQLNTRDIRAKTLSEDEDVRLVGTSATFESLHDCLFLDHQKNQTIYELRRKARRHAVQHGVDLILVDYLQLLSAPSEQYERKRTKDEELGAITDALDALAAELNAPVLSAVQLSRAVEQRADKRPILSDLRGSGKIEQTAKVALFLYRDGQYNPDTEKPNIAEIIVAKHRDGSTGVAEAFYKQECTQFTDMYKRKVDLNDVSIHYDDAAK